MQRCPKCYRTYSSDTQKFCTACGGRLIVDEGAETTPSLRETYATFVNTTSSSPVPPVPGFDPQQTVLTPPNATAADKFDPLKTFSQAPKPNTPPPNPDLEITMLGPHNMGFDTQGGKTHTSAHDGAATVRDAASNELLKTTALYSSNDILELPSNPLPVTPRPAPPVSSPPPTPNKPPVVENRQPLADAPPRPPSAPPVSKPMSGMPPAQTPARTSNPFAPLPPVPLVPEPVARPATPAPPPPISLAPPVGEPPRVSSAPLRQAENSAALRPVENSATIRPMEKPDVVASSNVSTTPARRSRLPLILGVAAVLLLGLIGVGVAAYLFVVKPRLEAQRQPVTSSPVNVPSVPDKPNSPSSLGKANVPPVTLAPPNAIKFVNDRAESAGKLAEHFVDFSFYYPKAWVAAKSANNFADLSRKLPDGLPQEVFTASWYESQGTYAADEPAFTKLAAKKSADLEKSLPPSGYRKTDEGPTNVNGAEAYQFRFQGQFKDQANANVPYWGRVIFLPSGDATNKNGVTLFLLATAKAAEVTSLEEVGVKGELPVILNTFRLGPAQ